MKRYKYDIRNMTDSEYRKWYSLTDNEKKKKIDLMLRRADRMRSVAADMLSRRAISEYCGVSAEKIIFSTGKNGKPYAVGLDIHFNASHSGNFAVCAVSERSVGIDIERIRPVNLAAAKRCFNDDELVFLFGHVPQPEEFKRCNQSDILIRFFRVWTAKEALIKRAGGSIADIKYAKITDAVTTLQEEGYIISFC